MHQLTEKSQALSLVTDITAIKTIKERLLENLKKGQYAGYDPFDGLNSRLLKMSGGDRFYLLRLAWIQFFKRSPLNFRSLAGIPKSRNPKGIALVILGLLKDFSLSNNHVLLEEAQSLGDWLLEHVCAKDEWRHCCWGYPFPWQARAFFVPVGTPNIITTSYAARALWRLQQATGVKRYGDAACDAALFIAESLHVKHGGRSFLAYIPGETAFVHNANLWGAAILAQACSLTGDNSLAQMARNVAWQSVKEQQLDGSWRYGERTHHGFIDSFHTGYNLEALNIIRKELNSEEFDASITSGIEYYRENFFLDDGTPKYYHNSVYPVDMHSVSQAVLTLPVVGGTKRDYTICENVMGWAIKHMHCQKTGWFYYQMHSNYCNKIPYTRWTQVWAYLALVSYSEVVSRKGRKEKDD